MVLKATLQKQSSKQSFPKVSKSNCPEAHCGTLDNQMIKYQLPHTRFDEISDHKHDIHLNGKLSTELLASILLMFY